jgi:hypothetical protein
VALNAPFSGEPVVGTWTDGVTALANGLLQSTTAQATGALTGLTTEVDVPGCSISVTATGAHAFAIVLGCWDVRKTNATSCQAVGHLSVDGTDAVGAPSAWDPTGSTFIDRQTMTYQWPVPLAAGAHVLKLRIIRQGGTGALNCEQGGSAITCILFDVP